jgi:tetratricopeptide (TPR) repeat protein
MQRLTRCARTHPEHPLLLLETARCLRGMGEVTRALQSLEQLDALSPGMPECQDEFGNCHDLIGNAALRDLYWHRAGGLWVNAKEYARVDLLLEKLLTANAAYAPGWNLKGMFHDAQLELEAAEAAFLKAIEIDPYLLDAHANLGNMYEHSNRVVEASALVETGLQIVCTRPGIPESTVVALHLLRSRLARREKQYRLGLDHLDAVAGMRKSELQRQTELFERAKLYDLLDDTDAAVTAFNQGNAIALVESGEQDNRNNKFLRGVEYMLALADKSWFRSWRRIESDMDVASPVFLVGFPRSGTTLLNTVLYSHSAIRVVEEQQTTAKMLAAVRQMPLGYPQMLAEFDAFDAGYVRDAYCKAVAKLGASDPAKLLIDKFPMHMTSAALIHRAFPRARFLFALRHPCDVVLSCFMQNFQMNDAMANFCTIGDTVSLYTKAIDLWQAYREQLPLEVHTIRYENVVDDFDGQIRALCEFLRVPWEDGLRQFSTRALDRGRINTPSYEQVSKPIYRDARYRWERYRKHLEPFLPTLHPYILQFGYDDPMAKN